MGQALVTPKTTNDLVEFVNLPKEALESLWMSYNILGEGWGLNLVEVLSVFNGATFVVSNYKFTEKQLTALFKTFDTDCNGLVDALEMFITIALISGMDSIEKIYFAFNAYDFDSIGSLSYDEITILIRSIVKGLGKISPTSQVFTSPTALDIDRYSTLLFEYAGLTKTNGRVSVDTFKQYSTSHPVLSSWLKAVASFPSPDSVNPEVRDKATPLRNSFPQLVAQRARRPAEMASYAAITDFVPAPTIELNEAGETVEIPYKAPVKISPVYPWSTTVDLMRPDEIPSPIRYDAPEDVFEGMWVNGINTSRSGAPMHRGARYTEDSTGVSSIVFTAANHLLTMKKGEETGWTQSAFTEHGRTITAMDTNAHRGILVTGDDAGARSKVVIWETLVSNAVLATLTVPFGVKFLDLSHNGTMLLVVSSDAASTATVYNISSYDKILPVFTTQLLISSAALTTINDVRFTGTNSMFAVGDTQGLRFFVEEGASVMGPNAMRSYEERSGLYQTAGKAARGVAVTALSRFENPDEVIAATEKGQITVWHGRTCAQLVEAHNSAVSALDFNKSTLTLISAAVDGSVRIFKIVSTGPAGGPIKKGPMITISRLLELDVSFDVLHHNLFSYDIRSAVLSADGNRVLVSTAGSELLELTTRIAPPTEEELEAAEAAGASGDVEGEEGGIASSKGKIGDNVHDGPIITGHYANGATDGVVTALCRVPGGNGFASCGADQTVRIWSNVAPEGAANAVYKVIKSTKMDCSCNGLDASATTLALSLSGGPNSARTGSVHLFSLPDLVFITELTDSKVPVSDIKFSPEGNSLAVASEDGNIYLYGFAAPAAIEGAVDQNMDPVWTARGTIASGLGAGEVPKKFDFSQDNTYVRTVYHPSLQFKIWAVAGETLGSELSNIAPPPEPTFDEEGELIPVAPSPGIEALKALTWASHSCPHNWDSKGALALNVGSDVSLNAFDRFNHLLVGAASNGSVTVDRVPALVVSTASGVVKVGDIVQFPAHMGAVSALCFIEEGLKLVTAGAVDGVIRVFKVGYDLDEPEIDIVDPVNEDEEEAPAAVEEEEDDGKPKLEVIYDSGEDEDLFDGQYKLKEHLSVFKSTDEATSAVATWAGALGLDSETAQKDAMIALAAPPSLVPNDELTLDWVYGCNTRATRGAVRYSAEGTIVYPAGSIGVIYDKLGHKQKYAMAHRDDISCLDVHLASGLAVTAHKGAGNISAVIWSTKDGSIKRSLDCGVVSGVSAVRFSNDGKYILAACQDVDHTNLVFGVADGRIVAQCKGGLRKTLNLTFSLDSTEASTSFRVLQGGANHFKFLTFQPHLSSLLSKTGQFGQGLKKSNVLCAVALPLQTLIPEGGEPPSGGNEFALGMADGSVGIVVRGEAKVTAFNPVMKGPVTAITFVSLTAGNAEEPPTYKIVAAGINGWIKIIDQECQPLVEFNLYLKEYGLHSLGRVKGFKSLCVDKLNRKLLFGTAGGEVGEIDVDTGADVNAGPLVSAHFRDQLHALCSHPLRQECLTAGDDQTLRIWDLVTRKQATKIELPDIARCATYAPNGHIIAVGLGGTVSGADRKIPRNLNGRVLVVSYLQGVLRIVHTANNAADTITSVLFSPDGSKLFAASLDGSIYLYDALDNFSLVLTMTSHVEGVAHIDASEDGKYLISFGVLSEIIVWDLGIGAPVPNEAERFEVLANLGHAYHVRQGTFGLNAVGIYPTNSVASDVLTLNQSKDAKLLATGDCYGALKLFRNPAAEYFAPYRQYAGHSAGGVSKVSFTVEDEYLLSVGRFDRTLIQWKVVKGVDIPDARLYVADPVSVEPQEQVFADTFNIKGVDFTGSGTVVPANSPELQPFLKSIAGVGNCILPEGSDLIASAALPKALFCGQGEILTAYGRGLALLQTDPSAQSPLLVQRPLLVSSYTSTANQQISNYTVSQCGRYALVGQTVSSVEGQKSQLLLVSVPAGQLVNVLSADIPGGVVAVAFSFDGKIVAAVGGDAQHSLHLFTTYNGSWDDASLLFSGQISAANINLVSFMAPATGVVDLDFAYDFVTAGQGHVKFWRIRGQNVTSECGNYEDGLNKPVLTAITTCRGGENHGFLISGDVDGNVHLWKGTTRTKFLSTHTAAVSALQSFSSPETGKSGFVTASNDRVSIWTSSAGDLSLSSEILISDILSSVGWTAPIYLSEARALNNYVTSISTDPTCSRLLLSFSSGIIVTVAADSRQVQKVSEGQGSRVVQVVPRPTDVQTVLTLSADNVVRVWDISRATVQGSAALNINAGTSQLAGFLSVAHTVTSATFLNSTVLLVGVTGGDAEGTSGSILVVDLTVNKNNSDGCKFSLVISNKIHNVGTGAVHQIRISPNNKQILACSADGCGYVYDIAPYLTGAPAAVDDEDEENAVDPRQFQPVGFLLAHPTGAALIAADFSADGRYVRTFGQNFAGVDGKVEVNFFDFEATSPTTAAEKAAGNAIRKHAAGKVQDTKQIEELIQVQWASVGSSAAPELRGVNYVIRSESRLLSAVSVSVNNGNSFVSVGYNDGTAGVFRFPVSSPSTHLDTKARIDLTMHSAGKVFVAFTGAPSIGSQQLVTVGETDGAMYVWNIQG